VGQPGPGHKDDAEISSRADHRIGRRLPAIAVFLAAALLVVAIAGMGRVEVVTPEWQGGQSTPEPLPPPTAEPDDPFEEWRDELDGEDYTPREINIPWEIALAILIAVLVAVAVFVARRMPRGFLSRQRRNVVGGHLDEIPDHVDELREAVKTATSALEAQHASGTDAVIEAWLRLEDAAEASGAPRQRAQTPSEFTTGLLRRYHADETATMRLRDLYHRARFATDPSISAADVEAARTALTTILDTLRPVTTDTVDAP
jgi:Na+-transporting methylmalonyl-CoA/oxaloacetate decarboxylase gamma subunit